MTRRVSCTGSCRSHGARMPDASLCWSRASWACTCSGPRAAAGRAQRSWMVNPDPWPRSGSSEVVAGHLGGERFIATIEPWHGNQVVVYRRRAGKWVRHVIDASIADGHTLVAGDFDGDGRDDLVAGERAGRRSAYLYRSIDPQRDTWSKDA